MTPRNFEWLLRLRGAALTEWPERERRAAITLLRGSAQARDALADALAREDDQDVEDEPALARLQLGLAAAIAAQQAPTRLAAGARWGALAACALLGAWLGAAQPFDQPAAESDPLQAISLLSPGPSLGALQP